MDEGVGRGLTAGGAARDEAAEAGWCGYLGHEFSLR
jgi:hypothetical protein